MSRICTLIAVILFLAASATASAQETPADWIRKLGSRNYADREKAARALERLGQPALTALREAMSHADLETKRRAILVMDRIEDRLMQQEFAAATPVRLRFEETSVDDALREVEKQTGLRLGNVSRKQRIAQLDTGALPFWQAWRRFCAASQLEENDYARAAAALKRMSQAEVSQLMMLVRREGISRSSPFLNPRIEFTAAPPLGSYAVDDRHSVRVRVKWQSLDRSIDEKMPIAIFAVEVRAEPRLEIVTIPRARITKIVDEQGQARSVQAAKLFPDTSQTDDASFLAAYVGEIQYGGLLQLQAIPWAGPPRSLKEVHGHVRMEVTVRPRMIEIPAIFTAVGKEARGYQGITLRILEAETTEEGDIHLRLHLDNLDSLTPQSPDQQIVRLRPGMIAVRGMMDVAMERLELLDHTGRKCRSIKTRYEQAQKSKGYEAELLFANPGSKLDGLTLVMTKAPRAVVLEIPFLVRDVSWTQKKEPKEEK